MHLCFKQISFTMDTTQPCDRRTTANLNIKAIQLIYRHLNMFAYIHNYYANTQTAAALTSNPTGRATTTKSYNSRAGHPRIPMEELLNVLISKDHGWLTTLYILGKIH